MSRDASVNEKPFGMHNDWKQMFYVNRNRICCNDNQIKSNQKCMFDGKSNETNKTH